METERSLYINDKFSKEKWVSKNVSVSLIRVFYLLISRGKFLELTKYF